MSDDHRVRPAPADLPADRNATSDGAGVIDAAWDVVRRRWRVIAATTLLTTALVIGLSLQQTKQYTASSSLLIGTASESVLSTGYVDRNRLAATQERLLSLDVVAQETAQRLGGRMSPEAIVQTVEIISDPSADVVEVSATTPNPQLSARVATEYARAFKDFRSASAREQIEDAIALSERGFAALTPAEREGPQGAALRDRINQLETAAVSQTGGVEVVEQATPPVTPSSPNVRRNALLGLILGAMLGFGIAALRDRSDRAIRSVEDLERQSGWPVLARVPVSRPIQRGSGLGSRSREAESFRLLRASLRYFEFGSDPPSLLITSARSGEGKSTTSRRLADAMASMGDRVVLVEADMHRRGDHGGRLTDVASGLSGYLIGSDLDDVLVEVPVGVGDVERTLTLLPSGPLPPNPSELLESARMDQLMDELREQFDVVIVDSPPLPVLSDAMTLLEHVSGVIVVAAVGVTTREDIDDVRRSMALNGGVVLGIVANFAPEDDRVRNYYYGEEEPRSLFRGNSRSTRRRSGDNAAASA